MKIIKKEHSILIKNRSISFIVLDFVEINAVLEVLNNSLPVQYAEIFNYLFNRIKPFVKDLNEENINSIFNNIKLLSDEFENNFDNNYLSKGYGEYEIYITPATRLKESIDSQKLNNGIDKINYFSILALALIGGVNHPGAVVDNIINSNPDKRLAIAGELAAYAMEAVDHAEFIYKEFDQNNKIRIQNRANEKMRQPEIKALKDKLQKVYYTNYDPKRSNREAARRLFVEYKSEVESVLQKDTDHWHTIAIWIAKWRSIDNL